MIGRQVLHYRILEEIGRGGMGVVYKAEDTKLGRVVALKFLTEHGSGTDEVRERFLQEAKAAAGLNHPRIATVYGVEEADGMFCIAMELVEGTELREKIRQGPLPVPEVLRISRQLAAGLHAAHARGVVHRDIKSSNIMVTPEGEVKIMDFGLAKVRGGPHVTKIGTTVGTAAYMSPEQARGDDVDQRSDIWSFGIVLYEMLAGHPPFRSDYEQAVIYSILNEDPAPLTELRPDVPPGLEAVVRSALRKEPQDRYASMDQVLAALDALSGPAVAESVRRKSPVKWWRWPAAALAVLVLIGLVYILVLSPGSPAGERSIAVLPFVNEGNNPETEYLSDGITEALISNLSPLPNLKVMARSTVFKFKGSDRDPRDIGRALDVGAVLSGRLDLRDDRLVVGVELVDVAGGTQLWGERFNRRMEDVFSIEEEIARGIAEELEIALRNGETRPIGRRPTESTEAYQLYLKGRYNWNKRSADAMRLALRFFQDATRLDPSFALAWSGIADCYVVAFGFYLGIPTETAQEKAKEAVEAALRLDPSLAEAQASLGAIENGDWNWKASEEAFQKALRANPGYATAHQWYGELLTLMGRTQEGITEIKRALELDPLSPIINSVLAWGYLADRDADRAIEQSHRTLDLEANFYDVQECLAFALLLAHRPDADVFREMVKRDSMLGYFRPEDLNDFRAGFSERGLRGYWERRLNALLRGQGSPGTEWVLAECYAQLGDVRKAVDQLEILAGQRDPLLTWMRVWVLYDPLRGDPGFQRIVRQVNFPD